MTTLARYCSVLLSFLPSVSAVSAAEVSADSLAEALLARADICAGVCEAPRVGDGAA